VHCSPTRLTSGTGKGAGTVANVAVRIEFHTLTSGKDRQVAGGLQWNVEMVVLHGKQEEELIVLIIFGHGSRQLIVMDGQFPQTTVSDGNVGRWKGTREVVVVQVQMPQFDRRGSKIVGERASELVIAQVNEKEVTPAKVLGNRSSQLVAVQADEV